MVAITDIPNPTWMSEEHVLLQDSLRGFIAKEIVPHTEQWRKNGVVERELWTKAGDAGFLGAAIPENYGGVGGGYDHESVVCLELARSGDASWGWAIQSIVVHYIKAYGTDEQKDRWLPGLGAGTLIPAIAMTEPGTGSDLQAVQTKADKNGDHYIVNGSKTFITNGQLANLVVVVAKTDTKQRAKGISLLMAETDGLEGFRRGRNLEKIGMKGQDTSELFFEDVKIPIANLLGGVEGRGFYQLMQELPWERLQIGIGAIGACDVMLQETLQYVKDRKAFGKRIYDFQNTRFKLAECKTKLEVSRAFTNECIVKLMNGSLDAATASMAKWWCAQIQCEIADECLQLFGGYGYMNEYPIARMFTDARVQQIYGGTREIMKELIARSLDDGPPR